MYSPVVTLKGTFCVNKHLGMKYSRRRTAFYSNSIATFNPSFDLLARCGDVHPMQGPQTTTSEHHSTFSLMLLNARSLVNKLVDFQASLYANSVDIVIVTETWITKFYQVVATFIVETEEKIKEVEEFL